MDVNVYNGQVGTLKQRWPDIAVKWDPVEEGKYFLSHWDFDGDFLDDTVSFDYSGGAHCCYKIHIYLSSDKTDHTFPFEMDGGYIYGVDDSNPEFFHIGDMDAEDGLPEIAMTIQTYNGEISPIPKKWQKEYGFKTNKILIGYDYKTKSLKVRDWKGEH